MSQTSPPPTGRVSSAALESEQTCVSGRHGNETGSCRGIWRERSRLCEDRDILWQNLKPKGKREAEREERPF